MSEQRQSIFTSITSLFSAIGGLILILTAVVSLLKEIGFWNGFSAQEKVENTSHTKEVVEPKQTSEQQDVEIVKVTKPTVTSSTNANYTVSLQTLRVPSSEFQRVHGFILSSGFRRDEATNEWSTEQAWLAKKSTILYYDVSTMVKAAELEKLMNRWTGKNFTVQQGAGFGVKAEEYKTKIVIHYID